MAETSDQEQLQSQINELRSLLFHIQHDQPRSGKTIPVSYELLGSLRDLLDVAWVKDDGSVSAGSEDVKDVLYHLNESAQKYFNQKPLVFPRGELSIVEALYEGTKVEARKCYWPDQRWRLSTADGEDVTKDGESVKVQESELTLLRVLSERDADAVSPREDELKAQYVAGVLAGAQMMADQISEDFFGGRSDFKPQFDIDHLQPSYMRSNLSDNQRKGLARMNSTRRELLLEVHAPNREILAEIGTKLGMRIRGYGDPEEFILGSVTIPKTDNEPSLLQLCRNADKPNFYGIYLSWIGYRPELPMKIQQALQMLVARYGDT
jgi:hypothetical protein